MQRTSSLQGVLHVTTAPAVLTCANVKVEVAASGTSLDDPLCIEHACAVLQAIFSS